MLGPVLRILGRRLVQFLPAIALATFVVYSLLSLVPGDLAILLELRDAPGQRLRRVELANRNLDLRMCGRVRAPRHTGRQ